MKRIPFVSPETIVEECGSYQATVNTVMELNRAIWELAFCVDAVSNKEKKTNFRDIRKEILYERVDFSGSISSLLINKLIQKNLCQYRGQNLRFSLRAFYPFTLANSILSTIRSESDLRYFIRQNIRQTYHCTYRHEITHIFQVLTDIVNSLIEEYHGSRVNKTSGANANWHYQDLFYSRLIDKVSNESVVHTLQNTTKEIALAYIESCRMVGYLNLHYKIHHVSIRTNEVDAEYLLSNLFGIPTDIRGFDNLFGGGGLILADHIAEKAMPEENLYERGRTIFIRGRYGTGKSILSLHLALEVARKGGIAWFMLLEQHPEDYLQMLESIGGYDPKIIEVLINSKQISKFIGNPRPKNGAIILLSTIKESYSDFLSMLNRRVDETTVYNLRLFCIDPVNSIYLKDETKLENELRGQTLTTLENIKSKGANVLMVSEERNPSSAQDIYSFGEHISDTAIRLSIDKRYDYAQRFFEITKSRLQREQRGEHPFSIIPGEGLRILISPPAVAARIRNRKVVEQKLSVRFGLASLDNALGRSGIAHADIIALQGVRGSYKADFGAYFVLGIDTKRTPKSQFIQNTKYSLVITTQENISEFRRKIDTYYNKALHLSGESKKPSEILYCVLPLGMLQPGFIFQAIDDYLSNAYAKNSSIDRILIHNLSHWEMSSPFIENDPSFGEMLIAFLRHHRVTSLFSCTDPLSYHSSNLQKSIINLADCLIRCEHIDVHSTKSVVLKVLRTSSMKHSHETYQIYTQKTSLNLKRISPLIRVGSDGVIKHIPIRLFLLAETVAHKKYMNGIRDSIRSVLASDTEVLPPNLVNMAATINIDSTSAIDELHIIQLLDYQLTTKFESYNGAPPLHVFSNNCWACEWDDFKKTLINRVRFSDGRFCAVPFYSNLGVVAYNKEILSHSTINSWSDILAACEEWERKNPESSTVFFEYNQENVDDLNCLFLEILISLLPSNIHPGGNNISYQIELKDWLKLPAAIEAGIILRRLCSRKHRNVTGNLPKADPVVWRHSYSYINQMISSMSAEKECEIVLIEPPGGISLVKDYFLGVPDYSTAPDVGLEIIKQLTSFESELMRLNIGIGLPTRTSFFNLELTKHAYVNYLEGKDISTSITMKSSDCNTFFGKETIRLSEINNYLKIKPILAYYLKNIIDIPDGHKEHINERVTSILCLAVSRMEFTLNS